MCAETKGEMESERLHGTDTCRPLCVSALQDAKTNCYVADRHGQYAGTFTRWYCHEEMFVLH